MQRRPWGQRGSAEELSGAFSIFDRDDSGFIDAAEFRHVMTTMGESLTDEQMDEMMRQFSTDGDGKVAFERMYSIYCLYSYIRCHVCECVLGIFGADFMSMKCDALQASITSNLPGNTKLVTKLYLPMLKNPSKKLKIRDTFGMLGYTTFMVTIILQ